VKTHDRSETFVLQGTIVITHQSLLNSIFTRKLYILMKKIYIFFIAFPFHHIGLSGTLRSTNFFPFSFGGAAGLRPPTPTLSSPLLFLDDTKRTQHNIHGRPIRPGIRTLLTSRWCRKSVALPSTTLPSAPDRHTHTSMARRRFLPSKKSSPFGEIRTH
jgi:hypothetical protein